MFHWVDVVRQDNGAALPNWQVECVQASDNQTVVPIFSDGNSTPITSVSGIANRAVSDAAGNYNFFVPDGEYSLRFYNEEGVYQDDRRGLPMYGNQAAAGSVQGVSDLQAAVGVAAGASNLGAFPGATIADGSDAKTALTALEALGEASSSIFGLTAGATNFGAFTGSLYPDDQTAKQLFQTSETAIEGRLPQVATRAALAAYDTNISQAAYLTEAGREGIFTWSAADLSTEVGIDTDQGIHIAPLSDPTGASGAWVRQWEQPFRINVEHFGAGVDKTASENQAAINAAIAAIPDKVRVLASTGKFQPYLVQRGYELHFPEPKGEYLHDGIIALPSAKSITITGAGQMCTTVRFTGTGDVGIRFEPGGSQAGRIGLADFTYIGADIAIIGTSTGALRLDSFGHSHAQNKGFWMVDAADYVDADYPSGFPDAPGAVVAGVNVVFWTARDCQFYGSRGANITVEATTYLIGKFDRCRVKLAGTHGMVMDALGVEVSGIHFWGVDRDNHATGSYIHLPGDNPCSFVRIHNNLFSSEFNTGGYPNFHNDAVTKWFGPPRQEIAFGPISADPMAAPVPSNQGMVGISIRDNDFTGCEADYGQDFVDIASFTKANPIVVTTAAAHGRSNGDKVVIHDANTTGLNGVYYAGNVTATTVELFTDSAQTVGADGAGIAGTYTANSAELGLNLTIEQYIWENASLGIVLSGNSFAGGAGGVGGGNGVSGANANSDKLSGSYIIREVAKENGRSNGITGQKRIENTNYLTGTYTGEWYSPVAGAKTVLGDSWSNLLLHPEAVRGHGLAVAAASGDVGIFPTVGTDSFTAGGLANDMLFDFTIRPSAAAGGKIAEVVFKHPVQATPMIQFWGQNNLASDRFLYAAAASVNGFDIYAKNTLTGGSTYRFQGRVHVPIDASE